MNSKSFLLILGLLTLHTALAAPDEENLGKSQNYPVGNIRNWTQPQYRIGSWSAPQRIEGFSTGKVEKSTSPFVIPKENLSIDIKYKFNLTEYSVDQYFVTKSYKLTNSQRWQVVS